MEEIIFLKNSLKNKVLEFRNTALNFTSDSEENNIKDKPAKLEYSAHLLVNFLIFFKDKKEETIEIFKKFPDVSEPIKTLFSVPTCPCRYRAVDFISKNIKNDEFFDSILELIEKQDESSLLEKNSYADTLIKNSLLLFNNDLFLPGKKIRIPNTPEAYTDKILELSQGYTFKGMNMYKVENDEYLDLYFY